MPEQEEASIHDIRVWVEEELNIAWNHAQMLADRLNRGRGARECALCITKIEEATHRIKDVKYQLEIEAL